MGRRLYTVRHRESGVERSIVCQIDAVEGSKKVTVRSPVQVQNDSLFSEVIFAYLCAIEKKKKTKVNYHQKYANCNRNTANSKKNNHYQ